MGSRASSFKIDDFPTLKFRKGITANDILLFFKEMKTQYPSQHVDKEGFRKMFAFLFPKANADEFSDKLFGHYDFSEDGKLDIREFLSLTAAALDDKISRKIFCISKMYDEYEEDYLTKDEILRLIATLYKMVWSHTPNVASCVIVDTINSRILSRMKVDKEDRVTVEEFCVVAREDTDIQRLLRMESTFPYSRRSSTVSNFISSLNKHPKS